MEETELIKPIHLNQPNEKPRPAFYRQGYFEYNGNIQQYIKHLERKWKQHGRPLEDLNDNSCKELEKYFTPGDIEKNAKCHNLIIEGKKNVIPGESIISKWSACDLWVNRKHSFLNSRQEELNEYALQSKLKNQKQVIDLQDEFRIKILQSAIMQANNGTLNGTQSQGYASANKNMQDAQNRELGEAKDINQSNIQADVNAVTENLHGIDETVYKELLDVIKPRYSRND